MFEIIISKIFESIIGVSVDKIWIGMKYIFKHNIFIYKYYSELNSKFERMPFIYKGLDSNLVGDFVDIQLNDIDASTFKLKEDSQPYDIRESNKLKNNKTIIFLGSAGIGKTTFQRFVILKYIKSKYVKNVTLKGEKVIPIYVPLKLVENTTPSPILKYIRKNNMLYNGLFGLKKLKRHLSKRKIFLFLDGYDEIYFGDPLSLRNYIRDELSLLIAPELSVEGSYIKEIQIDSRYKIIYHEFLLNRVWLSSRPEFFEKHPVFFHSDRFKSGLANRTLLMLKGIGPNRAILIKKIFNKYRNSSPNFKDLLNEEYFLNKIDELGEEFIKLSENPLFLTIMTYLYANKVIETNRFDSEWILDSNELVLECINLLLRDLDEYKVRDLPKINQKVIISRRNENIEKKMDFLKFFCGQLYYDQKNAFHYDYLKEKALEFFSSTNYAQSNEKILMELKDEKFNKTNIVAQLIYCGIFVLVDKTNENIMYDFPHRRFREVVATKYFIEPKNYIWLLKNLESGHLSEFIIVFRNSTIFNNQEFHRETLLKIFDECLAFEFVNHIITLKNYLELKPININIKTEIENFLLKCINLDNANFQISIDILKHFMLNDSIQNKLTNYIDNYETSTLYQIALSCNILQFYNPKLLSELLKKQYSKSPDIFLKHRVLVQYSIIVAPEILMQKSVINKITNSTDELECFYNSVAFLAVLKNYMNNVINIYNFVPDEIKIMLLASIFLRDKNYFIKINEDFKRNIDIKYFEICLNNNNQNKQLQEGKYFGITDSIIDNILKELKALMFTIVGTTIVELDNSKEKDSKHITRTFATKVENVYKIKNSTLTRQIFENDLIKKIKNEILTEDKYNKFLNQFVEKSKWEYEAIQTEVSNISEKEIQKTLYDKIFKTILPLSILEFTKIIRVQKVVKIIEKQDNNIYMQLQ